MVSGSVPSFQSVQTLLLLVCDQTLTVWDAFIIFTLPWRCSVQNPSNWRLTHVAPRITYTIWVVPRHHIEPRKEYLGKPGNVIKHSHTRDESWSITFSVGDAVNAATLYHPTVLFSVRDEAIYDPAMQHHIFIEYTQVYLICPRVKEKARLGFRGSIGAEMGSEGRTKYQSRRGKKSTKSAKGGLSSIPKYP